MCSHLIDETVTVLLTGRGRGAVATVLLHGKLAEQIIRQRFKRFQQKTKSSSELQLNKPYFGNWHWGAYDEELVVCRTDSQTFEVHCHGGTAASETILKSIEDAGATRQSPQEWLERSVSDRLETTALAELPNATTARIAALLLDQTRGALRQALSELQRELVELDLDSAKARLNRLVELGQVGTRLNKPFSVVLIGRPNAGKSSLINAIVGYERSIVFDRPGTTRDIVRAETAIDGWPIKFVDTAGVRETDDMIEKEGVRLAKHVVQTCDLALIICDLTEVNLLPDAETTLGLPQELARIRVGTKADLSELSSETTTHYDNITSAETGQGIPELLTAITNTLIPHPPQPGEAIPLDEVTWASLAEIKALLDSSNDRDAVAQALQRFERVLK